MRFLCVFLFCLAVSYGQGLNNGSLPTSLHNGLSEKIGNFSIELLYHTAKTEVKTQNFIMSPITVWTVLALISEGASGNTLAQINNALRIKTKNRDLTRKNFREIAQWLTVQTPNVDLSRINAIFVDQKKLVNADYRLLTKGYEAEIITLDFADAEAAANIINTGIANFTHGRIPHLVESSYFADTEMIITSGLYFKGQWSIPFNATSTIKLPFYSSEGQKTGEVNMMYNRHTYPFANIRELQARVIELPYGTENRLSMLIMLPNPKVSLEKMFFNFANVTLDTLFEELRVAKEDYGEDEVDCFIPRFKIDSNIDLTGVLKNAMGIQDLFDQARARLPHLARTPLYVTKVIHKAEIEVTEEGTTASAITAAEFSNRIGVVRFEANRPFTYLIIEKVTNSIVFAGFYQQPALY